MDRKIEIPLFRFYKETVIEVLQTESQLEGLGWIDYFVITAWNPFSQKLSLSENRSRNCALEQVLLESGAKLLKAIGRSRDWKWVEESFAVQGVSEEAIIQIAKKFEQYAIFWIKGGDRIVVSCID